MKPKQPNRRQFLKNGAALAGLTVGASAVARSLSAESTEERIDIVHKYGERSRFVKRSRIQKPLDSFANRQPPRRVLPLDV